MAKTNTEKIDDLSAKMAEHIPVVYYRFEETKRIIGELREEFQTFTDTVGDLTHRLAVVEERCRHLEKHTDRTWQVWLALIVAGVGLVVSLIKK